jgi:hypothetical protein
MTVNFALGESNEDDRIRRGTMDETVVVTTEVTEDIDDPILAELDDRIRDEDALMAPMGEAEEEEQLDPHRPYDLEIVKPRALDLRELCKLARKEIPPEIGAALGPRVPVLLYHGLTPFARPGERPRGVWGLGYEVRPVDIDAATVAISPDTELTTVGALDSDVRIGLSVGGEMEVPKHALEAVNAIPGVSLHGAKIEATVDEKFALAVHLKLALVKVEAGLVGAGGARWNVYRAGDRIAGFQPFLQTALLPKNTRRLKLTAQPWVVRRGWLFGTIGVRKFIPKPSDFEISLEGLEA